MTNNTNIVIAIAAETLETKNVNELKVLAQQAGIVGYSKMRKAELVTALTPLCKPEAAPVIEERDPKAANAEKLAKILVCVWAYHSLNAYKDGKRLFFKSRKYESYISDRERISRVTGDAIAKAFGNSVVDTREKWISATRRAYEVMAQYGFCTIHDKDVWMSNKQYDLTIAQYQKLLAKAKVDGWDAVIK